MQIRRTQAGTVQFKSRDEDCTVISIHNERFDGPIPFPEVLLTEEWQDYDELYKRHHGRYPKTLLEELTETGNIQLMFLENGELTRAEPQMEKEVLGAFGLLPAAAMPDVFEDPGPDFRVPDGYYDWATKRKEDDHDLL